MRVIITGGGTGGHIYPAIAIADEIKSRHEDAEILFVGTERGLEKTLVPQNGYPIRFITVSGIHRKNLLKNFKTLKDFLKGYKEAKEIIREFKPQIVIGTGGYVCGPVVKAASGMKIPTFIHEQNASSGLTNKMLEKFVNKVFIGFEEARSNFKKKDKVIFTGNPVRKVFFNDDKSACRAKLGIDESSFVVLSFGGSRGAAKINEVMTSVCEKFSQNNDISIFFVTGNENYDKIITELNGKDVKIGNNIKVFPYLHDIHTYLIASDLVISRSGALTVAEIMACGKPSILIPSPNVTGNHQYFNAKALSDKGGAITLEEKDVSADVLVDEILKIKNDRTISDAMAEACKNAMKNNATEIIYSNLK